MTKRVMRVPTPSPPLVRRRLTSSRTPRKLKPWTIAHIQSVTDPSVTGSYWEVWGAEGLLHYLYYRTQLPKPEVVQDAIRNLKVGKAPWPNVTPNRALKHFLQLGPDSASSSHESYSFSGNHSNVSTQRVIWGWPQIHGSSGRLKSIGFEKKLPKGRECWVLSWTCKVVSPSYMESCRTSSSSVPWRTTRAHTKVRCPRRNAAFVTIQVTSPCYCCLLVR